MSRNLINIANAYDVDIEVVERINNENPEHLYDELEEYIKNRRK